MIDKRSGPDEAESGAALRAEIGTTGEPASSSATASGGVDMQAFIGRQLRAVYDDVAKQPVPDRFIELMRQLDTKGIQN